MYYSRYSDKTMKSEGEDVLDLCVRKGDVKEGDVNGNEFADMSNGYYDKGEYHHVQNGDVVKEPSIRCRNADFLVEQHQEYSPPAVTRTETQTSPTTVIIQDKMYPDDRVHQPPNSTSPVSSQPSFLPDSQMRSHFLPLPTTISTITNRNGKPTRPFKAYPKEFLALATSEGLLDDSNKRYMEFRRQFLTQLHATTGLTSNKNMKRPVQSDSPNQLPSSSGDAKDQAYWERRKKNNEAAKKSRDARRAKEDEIAIRAAFLERENVRLKLELESLRSETDRLRCMLYSS